MTPERLEYIRTRLAVMTDDGITHAWLSWATEMADYVDLLQEDLRLTRAELVAEKHKALELRRGQGRAQ